MSTQVLGKVELITKQEVEAMLSEVVVPEADIDAKVAAAKTYADDKDTALQAVIESEIQTLRTSVESEATTRDEADAAIRASLAEEAQLRETGDNALQTRIEREEGVRQAADDQILAQVEALAAQIEPSTGVLAQRITDEETARTAAVETLTAAVDANKASIEALSDKESETLEDTVFATRLKNLPIAFVTVQNTDKTIAVGDVIATLTERYIPNTPVTFNFVTEVTESGADAYVYLSCRIDMTGNISVINKTILTTAFAGNINSTTVLYLTKE